jgi:hypothetical protein
MKTDELKKLRRFEPEVDAWSGNPTMEEWDTGDWVSYYDVEALTREVIALREAAGEALVTMEHAQKFIGWKEKMHPTGQELYAEALTTLRAVLGESE